MHKWKWENVHEIPYISIPAWTELGVDMAFSSRKGGSSEGPFKSLNLGLHVGDLNESVVENRLRLLELFNRGLNNMVCCQQVHGKRVALVKEEDGGRGAWTLDTVLEDCDAMISNTPGLILATFYADCLPIYFFDPVKRVVGIAHSGWKGTMEKIALYTINAIKRQFASKPDDILVFMGPGIGKCCFQVQGDLLSKVNRQFAQFDGIINVNGDKYTWDLRSTNFQILLQSGIRAENIISCDICTSCNTDLFFSYRAENGISGRMGALIGLKY